VSADSGLAATALINYLVKPSGYRKQVISGNYGRHVKAKRSSPKWPEAGMLSKVALSLLPIVSICLPVAAQKGQQIDWEAKALTRELQMLGDPEINAFLPDLYYAISRARSETASSSQETDPAARWKAPPRTSLMSLLNSADVREEIGMLDYQFDRIQERNREIQSKANERVLSLLIFSKDGSVDRQKVREGIEEIRDEAQQEIEEAVLPFQLKRLKQIAYHVQMRKRGAVEVITNDPLAADLGLTDDQKESLREKAEEIDEELAREIAKLRAKAKQKLFSQLRPDQQRKLSAITGEEFTYQEIDWRRKTGGGAGPAK
jgi:hypothetical protein